MHKFIAIFGSVLLLLVSCQTPEARRPLQRSSGSFIKESTARNKELLKQEEERIQAMINADTTRDYITSESGFWYYYNVKDSLATPMPEVGDQVAFRYDIKDLNGNVILSEEENGTQNYVIDQTNQDLISGIRDGLKLMKEGEQVTFLFPSYKAYGYYGIQEKLGVNVPVQSTVTLQSIKQTLENQ
ncbi:gliding motility-associated peptidyl-prolyl isomerase GldI [Altibacter sp. HG106]|uniref:gliding motility-associated peptidyl-prolyl isomerase GldI n=1 Tax=Altibacter sp. HG106 TaxID=3023937 RepID=UPI002350A715|nr:gliding motility-associated peptidyl-prolyl isomerase GldI [Altibacter sp. HG106]MDC7995558.1 gliding motility-associated peptidyl-prolyl isomerase GldI [Altibacter sp. HG106]